jgi:hypothetical protein
MPVMRPIEVSCDLPPNLRRSVRRRLLLRRQCLPGSRSDYLKRGPAKKPEAEDFDTGIVVVCAPWQMKRERWLVPE